LADFKRNRKEKVF